MSELKVSSSNKRIAKNVLALYARMLLMLIINLYTSRVLLDCLGVDDYGLNNVVGGFVTMLGFVNTSMTRSIQRFLNVELGLNNEEGVRDSFRAAITVQIYLALLILLLLETVGLWFLNCKMHIPPDRMAAANWVYQCCCITMVISIIKSPYNAIIIAKEKMNFYALISVLEAVMKVIIIVSLLLVTTDRLIAFNILQFISVVLFFVVTVAYSNKIMPGLNIKLSKEKRRITEILSFSGWNLFGSFSGIIKSQGINILINFYFSLAINAARSVAYMVLSAINQFASNFQMALSPQIVQSYAAGERERYLFLSYASGKMSFYLMWILIYPVIILLDPLLTFWLGNNVPEKTQVFIPIILYTGLIDSLGSSISIPLYATGKIKMYQIVVSIITIMVLPISYIFYEMGYPAETSMIISLVLAIVAQGARVIIWCKLIKERTTIYLKKIVIPAIFVMIISMGLTRLLMLLGFCKLDGSFFNIIIDAILIVVISIVTVYFIGISKSERSIVVKVVRNKFKK